MTSETIALGLEPDEILERNAGGLESTAYILSQLGGALEAAHEEFRWGDDSLGLDLGRRCKELSDFVEGLYLTQDARLTTTRECRACGGMGWYSGGRDAPCKDCEDCGTTGVDSFLKNGEDLMTDDPALTTRIHIEGGTYIRAQEPIGQVAEHIEDARRDDGWVPVTDPGNDLEKLVRVDRILWLEQEDELR